MVGSANRAMKLLTHPRVSPWDEMARPALLAGCCGIPVNINFAFVTRKVDTRANCTFRDKVTLSAYHARRACICVVVGGTGRAEVLVARLGGASTGVPTGKTLLARRERVGIVVGEAGGAKDAAAVGGRSGCRKLILASFTLADKEAKTVAGGRGRLRFILDGRRRLQGASDGLAELPIVAKPARGCLREDGAGAMALAAVHELGVFADFAIRFVVVDLMGCAAYPQVRTRARELEDIGEYV